MRYNQVLEVFGEVLGVVNQPGLENLGLRKGHAGSNPALSADLILFDILRHIGV